MTDGQAQGNGSVRFALFYVGFIQHQKSKPVAATATSSNHFRVHSTAYVADKLAAVSETLL